MTLAPRLALAGVLVLLMGAAPHGEKPQAPPPPPAETKSVPATPVVPDTPEPPDTHRRHTHGGGDRGGYNEDVTIGPDEDYSGDVVCVWGHAKIEGHVSGSVTVVMGTLDISGSVSGDVVSVMSPTKLASSTLIEGNLTHVGGSFERNGATVNGQVTKVPLPWMGNAGWGGPGTIGSSLLRGFILWLKLLSIFLFFVCALLLAAIVPDRVKLISEEVPVRLFTAILAGLVGYMLFAMIQLFLAITIIGIPVAAMLYLVFTVLKWLAMCGVFHQVGSRIGRAIGRDMSLIGGLILGWAPFALLRFVPCFGSLLWFLVEIVAFGLLILTRVGTRRAMSIVVARPPAPPPAPPAVDPGVSPVV